VVSAVQEAANTGETLSNAASNTGSSRMQGLAGAAGALAAYNTYNKVSDILKDPNQVTGVSINISLGSSQSSGSSHDESTTAVGSQVVSAGSVNVTARNPKPNPDGTPAPATANAGNIVIEGSQVIATKDINLNADRNIDLLAAGNTSEHSSQNQSSSASVGVGFALGGTQNGFTINASASRANGQANGESQSSTNTHVQAGGTLTFNSGGDTTLQGATASGNKVTGTVGGDLILTSLQDTNTYSEKQSSTGVGVSLCIPPICAGASTANVSVSKTNINSDYQSVGEQTAIRAGDGGFDIDVQGTTTLTGAQITSTDKAVQDGKNSFTSAGGIDMQDLQNSAQYDASSYSVSATVQGDSHNKDGTPQLDKAGQPIKGKPTGSAGYGSDSGQGSSTSTSGISGIAGDTSARTGDQETGLQPMFDAAKVKADVQSQVAITAEFGKNASKAWGDFANSKFLDAVKSGDEDEAKCWAPDGTCRTAGHFLIGGLTGGAAGAAGAGASSLAAPHLQAFLVDAGFSPTAASAITQLSVLGAGHAAGGAAAGGAAFNETSNNALLALPVLVEGVLAGGAMAARACLSSPTCLNALRMGGTTVVAKVAALLTPEDLMQIPGFAQSNPLPPVGPTITPADAQRVYGSPPLNNPEELKAWLGQALQGVPSDEADKWAQDLIRTLPAADQRNYSDLIVQQVHHICTDKNCVSPNSGGPWTPRFNKLFDRAGMSMQDELNKVWVTGHQGPHPAAYHKQVFDRLDQATQDKSGDEYTQAFREELGRIKTDIATPGSRLNNLVTKK
jgi:hypothetical protein